jgi:hypothetical protein
MKSWGGGQLSAAVVVRALDGRFLDGPVHSLDLPVGLGTFDLGQAVLKAFSPQIRSKMWWKAYFWCAILVNRMP